MQTPEFRQSLHELKYTAQVNQRYHQLKQKEMWCYDKSVKIGVAVLAMFALLAVFLPHELKGIEVAVASAAALAAIALNVVPVGEWMMEYGEMFRSWCDLLLTADQLEMKAKEFGETDVVPAHLLDRLQDLGTRRNQLDAMEKAPDDALLLRCQGDVNERLYGKGVRSHAQVTKQPAEEEAVQHVG